MSLNRLSILISLLVTTACGSSSTTDKALLDEAARYHLEAAAVQARTEPAIEQIDSLKQVLRQQSGRPALIASLDSLQRAFAEWESNVVEPPGLADHPHEQPGTGKPGHAHHHHDHTPNILTELPPDQMRDLQREMLAGIRQIDRRMAQLRSQVGQP